MKAFILGAMLLSLLASSANAVDITFSFGNKSKTFVITGANAMRIVQWATDAYPTIPNPAYVTPCGSPLPACLPQTISNPEPVLSAINGLWEGLKANVISNDRAKAHGAVAEPMPIN